MTEVTKEYKPLHMNLLSDYPHLHGVLPVYRDFRRGDVRHSQADIIKWSTLLCYQPTHHIGDGINVAFAWYRPQLK